MLFVENEEYAKYFSRNVENVVEFDGVSPRKVQLRRQEKFVGRHFDIDEHRLAYLESFRYIVQRRSPSASRPPANYRLDYRNEYYDVWRRLDRPAVVRHLPIGGVHRAAGEPSCRAVLRLARRARPGEELVAARRQRTVLLEPASSARSPGWHLHPDVPETVVTTTPGRAWGTLPFDGGDYRLWIRGSFGRTVTAWVDGRRVGEANGADTPGAWQPAGVATVDRGRHRVELRRGGGGFGPGDGYLGELGPVAFQPTGRGSLAHTRRAEGRRGAAL